MGWTNSDNKFGPSKFMVGTVLGDGVNYTSIASAMADAAPGPADIYIRPGTYTENLNFPGNVNLIGASLSGDTALAQIIIDGSHQVAVQSLTVCRGIRFVSTALTDNFTVQDALGGVAALELIDCSLLSTSRNFFVGSGAGSGQIKLVNCSLVSNGRNIEVPVGAIQGDYELRNCYLISTSDAGIYVDAPSTGIFTSSEIVSGGSSNFYFDSNAATASLNVSYSYMEAPAIANITFQSAATVNSYHNTYRPATSEYITGPGNYNYGDDVIVGPDTTGNIDNAAVQTKSGWRPWAESTASPGVNSVKGTCSFDSAQFTVTDGFVQILGGNPPPFTDVSGAVLLVENNGYYATAASTLTLPAAPVQGDLVIIYADTAAAVVVTANAGQTIRLGSTLSSVAGTATSTAIGDSLTLRYRSANTRWECVSSIGNWTLA